MARTSPVVSLALVAGLLAAGWGLITLSADSADATGLSERHTEGSPAPFPWTSVGEERGQVRVPSHVSAQHEESLRKGLEQLLLSHVSGGLTPDEKHQLKLKLHELKQDPVGRSLMVNLLFASPDSQQAESLYELMRDADLKDLGLLEDLIQRARSNFDLASKTRLVDLIADLGTQKDAPSAAIDHYLTHIAQGADPQVREAAATQRIWYLAHHRPDAVSSLEAYLVDGSAEVRQEMYSLIESRLSPNMAGRAEFVSALNAALRADHLGMPDDEKARASALLQSLTAP